MDDQNNFTVRKRTVDGNTVIAYIDLLGIQKYYTSSTPVDDQAYTLCHVLLNKFDINFREHFKESEDHFDISIYADSIVICQRSITESFSQRIVDFLLGYQQDLLVNDKFPSRAIVVKDAFFSLKVWDAPEHSILGSQYTNISLCGGKGIIEADRKLKGLPIGIYVTEEVRIDLKDEQQKMVIPVRDEPLYFVKQKVDGVEMPFLHNTTLDLILTQNDVGCDEICNSLRENGFKEKDAYNKWVPWILVHMGKLSEVIRE